MIPPTWNVVWLYHPIIRCYDSYYQGEEYLHVFILSLLFKLNRKANTKEVSVTCVATIQVQYGDLFLLFQQTWQFLNVAHSIPY